MKKLFSIKDTKIGFMTPWKHHSEASAIRDFNAAVNAQEPNPANQDIEDKELWMVGAFCEDTGAITSELRFLCRAIDMKKVKKEVESGVRDTSESSEN